MKRILIILAALFATAHAQTIQTIGAPTTTVVSRGNFRTDSIFYLPKRQKLPTDSGAVRYQISDSSVYYWTGSNWRRLGVHIDTAAMLLPYLRAADTTAMLSPYLKESDTVWLSNRINLKVNIADTSSMLTPYLRGSGTANYFPKFDASRSVINSKLYESGTNLLFNTTVPSFTSAGITTIENNATSSAVYTYKIADTIRAYMGYGGSNTFDINNLKDGDIRFYTSATLRGRFQTDGTFRLNSLTGTGSRIVTADANGVLSATSSATGLVDTTVLSTRAWRQKGDDSLGAIIATKGSGTVTSVATGYGLSGGTITTTGTISADTALLASRLRVGKVVDSLALVKQNVLTNPVTGTGTTNYVPKFTGTSTIGNSSIQIPSTGEILIGGSYNPFTSTNRSNITMNGPSNNLLAFTDGSSAQGYIYHSGGRMDIFQSKNDAMAFFTNTIETFRATASNEVLIGTTTDRGAYPFQVGGSMLLFKSSSPEITFVDDVDVEARIGVATVGGTTYGSLTFNVGQSTPERMRITSSGELLLATTTDAGDYKLQVSGNAYVSSSGVFAVSSGGISLGTTTTATKTFRIVNRGTISFENAGGSAGGYLASVNDFDTQLGNNNATLLMERVSGNFIFNSGSTGELLVRTATDAGDYALQVSGNIIATNTNGQIRATNGTVSAKLQIVSTLGLVGTETNHPFTLYTNNQERVRIAESGNVGINNNTPNASAILDVASTTQGFLPPRMTTTQRDAISSPAAGLVIYNTTTSKLQVYTTSWTDLH